MKRPLSIFLGLATLLLFATGVSAKRILPRVSAPATTTTASRNISIAVKFREDRNAIVMTLSNLSVAQSITYQFEYESNGVKQGTTGTITDMSDDPTTRELLFGTCSNTACRYDTNITNARLVVTTTLKNGTRIVKPYLLKR